MRVIVGLAVGAAAMALGGCATLSEEQCLVGDWYGIGQSDGASGYGAGRLSEHVEACVRHGVSPDARLYEQGRMQGLQSYCTPISGYRRGRDGATYSGVCPGHLEEGFLAGYSDGRMVQAARQAYNAASRDRSEAESRARDIESQIRTEENALGASDLTDEMRRVIRERLRRLRDDRERTLREANEAQWAMREAERERDMLEARFSAYYGG